MQQDSFSSKAEAYEAFDVIPLSPPADDTIGAVIARRYSRRDMLRGSLAVTAATAVFGTTALTAALAAMPPRPSVVAIRRKGGGRIAT